jgi:hypothetical protein
MKLETLLPTITDDQTPSSTAEDLNIKWQRVIRRRSFLHGLGMAGAALSAGALMSTESMARTRSSNGKLSPGDTAVLQFLCAAEILESDLWTQYTELGGVGSPTGGNPAYTLALQNLDGDMPQYIRDNTDDELSHAAFLNAYLIAKGEQPVNLEKFRTLPSSKATGARQIKRLTNLLNLDIDLSYYTRYRSAQNPDLGANFNGPFTITGEPAIPLNDTDTPPNQTQPIPPQTPQEARMQAIANTAAFHFAFIEVGGSSLYTTMLQKVHDAEVLRIVASIGGTEIDHFSLWHDKLGNAVSAPVAGVTDPETGLTFPNLNNPPTELTQTNKILPEPCDFLSKSFPKCSVIRPSTTENSGATAAATGLTANLLFQGQSGEFFETLIDMAEAADAAQRGF